ncbi:MAG: SdpI family protein [Segetibacter sp.]|nr:SdpI family protein [Segetibacter sp.]
MNRNAFINLFVFLIIISPAIYLANVYATLPQTVGLHFGIDGKPDRFGDKHELWQVVVFLIFLNAGIYLLLKNIHKIDPKKKAATSKSILQKIAFAVVLLLTCVNIMVIQSSVANGIAFDRILLPLMGLFFAYLGNLMYSVKPNYFVGIRTPWALEDDENWRKTHHLAGKLWFAGGILIAITTCFLPAITGVPVMIGIVVIMTLIPGIYSYRYFAHHKKSINN